MDDCCLVSQLQICSKHTEMQHGQCIPVTVEAQLHRSSHNSQLARFCDSGSVDGEVLQAAGSLLHALQALENFSFNDIVLHSLNAGSITGTITLSAAATSR